MAKRRTQTDAILAYMKENGGITSMEAFELFGATRLSAIIFSLRKKGYRIVTDDKKCVTRWGQEVHYANYILLPDLPEEVTY